DAVPTLVFDEVDQGIGGEVGGRVGEALAAVTRDERRQALVITHLPQIAAYARHQLVVAKGARGGVATSDVRTVTGEARTRELARMLGDPDMETALGHAAELLRNASASSGERAARAVRRLRRRSPRDPSAGPPWPRPGPETRPTARPGAPASPAAGSRRARPR